MRILVYPTQKVLSSATLLSETFCCEYTYILIRALVGFIRALKEDPLPMGMFGVLHEKEKYHVSVIESTPTKIYIIIEREREILHSNCKLIHSFAQTTCHAIYRHFEIRCFTRQTNGRFNHVS